MSVNPISMKDIDEKEQEFRISCQTDHESANSREKLLILLAFIFLVLVLSLLSAIVISIAVESLLPKSEICMTEHCVKRAGDILESLNDEIRPCDNFYSYSCGGWKNKNLLSLPNKSILLEIQYDILRIMNNIIHNINKSETSIQTKVAKITKSCIEYSKIYKNQNLRPSYETFFKEFGGFPLASVSGGEDMTTATKIANLYRLFGIQPILQIEVSPNDTNNAENILIITPPSKAIFEDIDKDINFTIKFLTDVFETTVGQESFGDIKTLNNEIILKLSNTSSSEDKTFLSSDDNTYKQSFGDKFDGFISSLLTNVKSAVTETNSQASTESKPIQAKTTRSQITEQAPTNINSGEETTVQPLNSTISEEKTTGSDKLIDRRRRNAAANAQEKPAVKILVKYPDTVKNILEVLGNKESETISNFLSLQFLKGIKYNDIINPSDEKIQQSISKNLEDETVTKCLLVISEYLNYAFGYIYKSNVAIPVDEAKEVVEHVKLAMKSFIPNYGWLNNSNDNIAVTKTLDEMEYFIGYPSWLTEGNVEKYYEDLKFDANTAGKLLVRRGHLVKREGDNKNNVEPDDHQLQTQEPPPEEENEKSPEDSKSQDSTTESTAKEMPFIEMYMKMVSFNLKKNLEKLFVANDKKKWPDIPGLSIISVNAYYSASLNVIVLPAAILNPPIFDVNVPFYLNFGALGTVVGHEITHGFDTNGRRRDEQGNLPGRDMWSDEANHYYTTQEQCFINQYTGYSTEAIQINGNKTLSENIADNGAISQALEGYRNWLKHYHNGNKESSLPALDHLTHEQIFFISYAQSWCHTAPRTSLKELEADEHTINQFRVIGSLSNSEEFSKAFRCAENDAMNRKVKCKLW